jgi:prepilin-type N-terminal cleavage/methylation domain-containing protein
MHTDPQKGMTLIETLVAITILTVAIVAPMSLTMQSLSAAYYARDQIAAFNLGQEAIESVRSIRDGNILRIAYDQPDPGCAPMTLLCNIPIGTPFVIDTRDNAITTCSGTCPALQTDGDLYGYQSGWADTRYTRTVSADFVEGTTDEIRVSVTVTWVAGPLQTRTFTIYENLYRWVNDGSV